MTHRVSFFGEGEVFSSNAHHKGVRLRSRGAGGLVCFLWLTVYNRITD